MGRVNILPDERKAHGWLVVTLTAESVIKVTCRVPYQLWLSLVLSFPLHMMYVVIRTHTTQYM